MALTHGLHDWVPSLSNASALFHKDDTGRQQGISCWKRSVLFARKRKGLRLAGHLGLPTTPNGSDYRYEG